jgi:nucleotide-binding universal stress UspA family protein
MKILLATDGSDFSQTAVEKCCEFLVDPARTEIKIVSVYEQMVPMAAEPFAVSAEYYQEMMNAARMQSEAYVERAAAEIRARFPGAAIEISTEVRMGAPGREVIEMAGEFRPDVIVVGSHGRGFWGRLTLGSVSDAISHHAPCSVLIVRDGHLDR